MRGVITLIILPLLLAAETSVFDNKGIESKKKYGFSETEEFIYTNKKDIDFVKSRLYRLEEGLKSSQSSQEGLLPIVQNNSKTVSEISKQVDALSNKSEKQEQLIKNIELQMADFALALEKIKSDLQIQQTFNKTAEQNDKLFETKMQELIKKLEKLETVAVSKGGYEKTIKNIINELAATKEEVAKLTQTVKFSKPEAYFKEQKPEEIFKEAVAFLRKNSFDEARVRLFYLLNNTDYHKGIVLFNIGEVEYKQGRFKSAIESFKASGKEDKKASYMPVLLYHTGVSYEKLKDTKTALQYYKILIKSYPKSYLVKGAKNRAVKLSK